MAVTIASFRAAFPAFASDVTYPDAELTFWLALGLQLIGARWKALADFGLMLFVAHNLTLEFNAKAAAAGGQNPGPAQGPLTSASVDKVSYSRDAASVMEPDAGHWNLSIYGMRYIRLVRMVGAGPVQVGASEGGNCASGAWAGPWQYNTPNPS